MIESERIQHLNSKPVLDRENVIYWMQSSQRLLYNHAFEYAIQKSTELNKNLIVFFGIAQNYPEANRRHFFFMLEGIQEIKAKLENMGIRMIILKQSPEEGILSIQNKAALIVTDRGYLSHERQWRQYVAQKSDCKVVQIETNVIIPIETTSDKEEYSAATIRKKIYKKLDGFVNVMEKPKYNRKYESANDFPEEFDIQNLQVAIEKLKINMDVKETEYFKGGERAAQNKLKEFLDFKLKEFATKRNDPSENLSSDLSPYLHFGQISPLDIYIQSIKKSNQEKIYDEGLNSFLEELIVRRELSMNFVYYNPSYDSYECIPNWAKKTLEKHKEDPREYIYKIEQLEYAKTHDEYWNASQSQLLKTGKMQGYMRMYWGKKIIEWSKTPQEAYQNAIYLNNKYELDGRDPNGYAGVAWCFGKHDRPWKERNIFGITRYMAKSGLERKFNMKKYKQMW